MGKVLALPETMPLDAGTPGAVARLDPLIAALVRKLPKAGEEFPEPSRARWLKLMGMALEEAYGETKSPAG